MKIYLLSKENRKGDKIPLEAFTSRDVAISRATDIIYKHSTLEDRQSRIEVSEYSYDYTTLSLYTSEHGLLQLSIKGLPLT